MAQRWTEHVVCIGFERYSRLRSFHHPCISFSFDIILGYFFHFAFQDTSASTLLGVRPEILHHEARTQNSLSQNDRYSIDRPLCFVDDQPGFGEIFFSDNLSATRLRCGFAIPDVDILLQLPPLYEAPWTLSYSSASASISVKLEMPARFLRGYCY